MMSNMRLVIQHGTTAFEPPVLDGVKVEWERTGAPGKLTFTTIKVHPNDMSFQEGDPVFFYYNEKLIFAGYVFTKTRDKEHHIEVTCYDQLRYLKNKFSYNFSGYTATNIIRTLANDFKLNIGTLDNTSYVIQKLIEENIAALDIMLTALDETLLNTGNMFVLYDDCGELTLKNCANMVSTTLIAKDTAENFDYTSSIDKETYNSIVLYYKENDTIKNVYTANDPTNIGKWGILQYFEEVKTQSIGQNKANALLKLYNKKTRELTIKGAFGDSSVRGGTLIPIDLDLGDVIAKKYMLVKKVTHNFNNDHYTMDLTLEGEWED